jgi:hypothetical protein
MRKSDEKEKYIHYYNLESLWLVETNCNMNGMGFRVKTEPTFNVSVGLCVFLTLQG